MKTLLIGNMKKIDEMYHWFEVATEYFEVELIISESELESEHYICPISSLEAIEFIENVYDIIFLFSENHQEQIKKILSLKGVAKEIVLSENQIINFLTKKDIMNFYSEKIYKTWQIKYNRLETIRIGEFTYGFPDLFWTANEKVKVTIGKFCSIASNVTLMLGGEHNTDLCTTYPFNEMMSEFAYIKEYPKMKGDILIGNDVWLGAGCRIMSGIHIGNGAVVGANAVVTKDVEPYAIVAGVPAKVIRKRFDDETIQRLEEIQWWNWEKEQIYDAIPLLQSNSVEALFEYYDNAVRNMKETENDRVQ